MVMGSLFDTPTDEEDQNPPQPQQPPLQDPMAQQPVSIEPQPAQLPAFSDQDSINRAQAAVGNALQGVNTVAQLGAPPPVQGPPVPQPAGPLVNSTGLPTLNTPNPDLPVNQGIIAQGQQAQQALAQNGPTINYQNGQPYYGPSFGDAFLQGAVGAGIGAPIFGPAGAAIRTAGSMLGGSAAPAAVSALGGNPTEQRIAGTIGSLAPFTGANPWALAGGVGGSEFGQRTGLDVSLPFVGSADTLIGAGLPGLFRGGARAANADPLAGIQSPQVAPAATGIASALDTPKYNWFSDMSATETPWDEANKAQTPQYQANIATLRSAQTGQPAEFTGFRQEGPGERRPGTGTFYGIDPSTSSQYGLDRGNKAAGPDYLRGGPDSSLTIDRVQLQNPLVVEGGHYELGQSYQNSFVPSPARDALTEFWRNIPENPSEAWYVKSDQLIADAAKASGYDGIVYRRPTEDFGDFANWGKNVASPLPLSELGSRAINDTEIVKFDQAPTTTTTAPTSTTTTSGAYPGRGRSPDELDAVDAANALRAAGVHPQEQLIGVTPNGTRFEVPPSLMGHVDVMSGEVRDSRLGTGTPMSVFQRIERPDGTVLWDRGGQQPTPVTTGAYPPRDQFASDEHQQGYYQGLLDTTQLAPHEFRPTRGPDDTDFNQGYKEARANLPPGSLINQPYMPPPEAPTGPAGFRPVEQGLIAEGTDGTIHNITGFLGARGDGEQFFQTEDGVVPLSQLTNLSAADRAELGQMRTAAGGMPPNTPNAAPPSGPNAPGAAAFQQSPAGQQFAGQGAAGMNVTQPGVSSSNAAPSTTYGGGAGGITGQAPPAGRSPSGGGRGGTGGDRGGPPISKNFGVLDYLNIPRTLMAGGDASMSLRQSIVMAFAHPQRWLQSLDTGAQAFTSDIAAKDFADQIANDPLRDTILKNVYQAPTGRGEGTLSTREEQYASPATIPLIESIPGVGKPIGEYYRATERGTLTQLNQVRWDVPKDFALKLIDSRGETPPSVTRETMGEINQAIAPNGDRLTEPSVDALRQLKPESQEMVTNILNQKGEDLSTVTPYTQRMIDKYASAVNEATGRGTLGSAAVEKAVLPLSQVFFSWRNAVAKPEYVAQIFSEPFTPAWNAIVKDQAAFLVGGATTLGLLNLAAKQAGVPIQIGLDPRSADFGKAVIGNAHIDIWGGFQQPARAAWQAVMAAEGKPNAVTQGGREYQKNLGDIGITYLGNKLSPQAALAGQMALMQYGDRLSPGTLDALHEAFPTNRQPSLDLRTASQFLTPLWVQDMASAIKNDGVGTGIPAGAASFMGVGVQDYKPTASGQRANAGTQALSDPTALKQAFTGEDKPLATILQGKNWNDLMSTEKSALTKTLSPELIQQIHDESFRQNPETTKHSDTVQYISDKKLATENATLDRYNRKEITADEAASQMKAAQKEYFAVKNQLDSMPGYLAEQKKFDKSNESGAQIALDGFYQIPDKAGRAAYVAAIMQHDPELGARLLLATQPRNQSKLEELYYSGQLK